jgi:pantoate--beta-alanine ligase
MSPHVTRTVAEFRALRPSLPAPVGLVPTMGFLHDGHRSLMRRAREECATVVATIFVNPTQFGPNEDFDRYPRDEARDLAILETEGVDAVFIPSVEEMYPSGATTTVTVGRLSTILEGGARPGHFDGVATVVTKLFTTTWPDRAYFGQKDAQQVRVIRRLVTDLLLPVELVICPIVREPDGLALSSRNVYLSPDEREQALALSRALQRAEAAWNDGIRNPDTIRGLVVGEIEAQPLASIDYVSLADAETLEECFGRITGDALLSLAVRFGATRLIDNVVLRA